MKSAKELVAEASRAVETLTAEEAVKRLGETDTVFVDVREGGEVRKSGKLKGAVHVPRGFLEFQVDPSSPTHKAELSAGKRLVLYCGSGSRSALAAKTLKEMGVEHVAHVDGGFPALQKVGADVEQT